MRREPPPPHSPWLAMAGFTAVIVVAIYLAYAATQISAPPLAPLPLPVHATPMLLDGTSIALQRASFSVMVAMATTVAPTLTPTPELTSTPAPAPSPSVLVICDRDDVPAGTICVWATETATPAPTETPIPRCHTPIPLDRCVKD